MNKPINLIHFAFLSLIIFIMSCSDCTPSEHLGTKQLFPVSKVFIPDINENNTAIYKDSAGNEMKFMVERTSSFENHQIGFHCPGNFPFSFVSDEVSVETINLLLKPLSWYHDDFGQIEYKVQVFSANIDSLIELRDTNNLFYDILFLKIDFLDYQRNTMFPISDRNNDIPDLEEIVIISDTTILNKSFSNVFVIDDFSQNDVLYSVGFGIITMKDKDGTLWVFDRFL